MVNKIFPFNSISQCFSIFFLLLRILLYYSSASAQDSDTPYKVFRIFPRDWTDIQSLSELKNLTENEVDFWLESHQPGRFADVMVSPQFLPQFDKFLMSKGLNYTVTINDVQKLIYANEFEPEMLRTWRKSDRTVSPLRKSKTNSAYPKSRNFTADTRSDTELQSFLRRRMRNDNDDGDMGRGPTAAEFEGLGRPFEKVGELRANYPFGLYTNYATMLRYLRTLDFYYPHIVQLVQIGKTHEGRSIEGVKIGYPANNSTGKRAFWIDGNIHAREWASSHTALFIINQLIAGYGKDPDITHYVNKMNFIIVPCVNPDGFEYSRSSLNPQIRLWRKNRSPEQCAQSLWGGLKCCQGVDLNRNFDFHFGETGSSPNPCSNLYAGQKAFSEPEAMAISSFLQSQEYKNKLDGFITLHTYAQMWIHPFSHEVQYYPTDVAKIKRVAERATERLREVYGTKYRVGTGADMLAPASGGSDDWAKEKLGAKYVYLVELRPQLELSNGFILKQEELIPTAIETFEAIKVVIDAVLEDNGLSRRPKESAPSPPHRNPESSRAPTASTTRTDLSMWTSSNPVRTTSKPSTSSPARSLLQIHPMVFEELKKQQHSPVNIVPSESHMHGSLQQSQNNGQVFSKINLSVSQNIAFSGDEPQRGPDLSQTIENFSTTMPTSKVSEMATSSVVSPTKFSAVLPISEMSAGTEAIISTQIQSNTMTEPLTETSIVESTTANVPIETFSNTISTTLETSTAELATTKSTPAEIPMMINNELAEVFDMQTVSEISNNEHSTAITETESTTSSVSSSSLAEINTQLFTESTVLSTSTKRPTRRLPPTIVTATNEIRQELVLPTTRPPTRHYALRLLTSAPLSGLRLNVNGNRTKPKNKEEASLDNPLTMDIPPLIPEKVSTTLDQHTFTKQTGVPPHGAAVQHIERRTQIHVDPPSPLAVPSTQHHRGREAGAERFVYATSSDRYFERRPRNGSEDYGRERESRRL
ncbi:zinc carboxypeptidase domain-containing protein [Ditylenchus destructor]|nr:zinc carboxypeptidase domain-containing protein [Ditylenchus destructor]